MVKYNTNYYWLSIILIIIPAILWVIPDKNIEEAFVEEHKE